jgi:hypothetical protein
MSVVPGNAAAESRPPMEAVERSPGVLPRRLTSRNVARAALVYGVIGLVLTALTLGAAFWAGAHFQAANERLTSRVERLQGTLNSSAVAIEAAAAAVGSAGNTLDQTAAALDSAAGSVNAASAALAAFADTSDSINILGQRPFAGIGDGLRTSAGRLADLSARLGGVATSLRGNRGALDASPAALANLAASLRSASDGLADDVTASLNDVQAILTITFLAAAMWFGAAAVAAIILGLWLRRYTSDEAASNTGLAEEAS